LDKANKLAIEALLLAAKQLVIEVRTLRKSLAQAPRRGRPPRPVTPAPTPKLIRPSEVAVTLGVGKTKVYELIASGALPAVQIPSRTPGARADMRVRRADVDAWIAKQ